MRYLLLLYGEPVPVETLTPAQWKSIVSAHTDFTRELPVDSGRSRSS